MPYFGKTKYAIVDDYGPYSVAVFHFTTHDKLCVALDTPDGYVFVHNGKLYMAGGKIELCQSVEALPESQYFSMCEQDVIEAVVDMAEAVARRQLGGDIIE